MKVVIGLGNPGQKHAHDRHNVGFMVLDALARSESISFERDAYIEGDKASCSGMLLVKPQTYMNDSGKSARMFKDDEVVVVYDDIDISLGEVKCSYGRGSGGHNGVQSVIDHLGTKDFFRIRVGVRPVHEELQSHILPPDGFQNFLLKPFAPFEAELKEKGIARAVAIIEALKTKSFDEVMNEFN